MEEMLRARYGERARSVHAFSESISLALHVFTNLEALQTLSFGFSWKFDYIGMIN